MFNAHWNLCIGNNSSISIEGFHEEEVEKNFEAKKSFLIISQKSINSRPQTEWSVQS